MTQVTDARVLFEAAERDILTLVSMSDSAPDEAYGFHVQQAAEKALKAWLAVLGQVSPRSSDLDVLLDMLDAQSASTGLFRQLADFTPYAVRFRYAGLGDDHEPIDRSAALILVRALVRQVQNLLAEAD